MSKRIVLSLGIAAVFALLSSAAFAGQSPAATASDQAFLATLQAPAAAPAQEEPGLSKIRTEPAPVFKSIPSCATGCCSYSCQKCTATSVKLCAFNHCTGASGCDPCHSGTVCSF
jgi:hypothetical protein